MSTTDDPREERVVIEVRLVFQDGSGRGSSGQESVFFTWADVKAGAVPEIRLQDWMVQPQKSYPHPTEPLVYSMLVAPGREADARAWLASLREAPA